MASAERERITGAWVRGSGGFAPEAENLLAFECPMEAANLPHSPYFANSLNLRYLWYICQKTEGIIHNYRHVQHGHVQYCHWSVWRVKLQTCPTPPPVKTHRICINLGNNLWQKWGSPPRGDAPVNRCQLWPLYGLPYWPHHEDAVLSLENTDFNELCNVHMTNTGWLKI